MYLTQGISGTKPGIVEVSGDDGLFLVSVCGKLLAIHVILKGSKLMDIIGQKVWTVGLVVLNLPTVAL
jgi:hypothetical protein